MKKKYCILIIFFLMLSLSGLSNSWGGQYAYVNFNTAVNDCDAGQKAKSILTAVLKEKQSDIDNKEKKIDELKNELEGSPSMSADTKKVREQEINELIKDYQKTVSDAQGYIKAAQKMLTEFVLDGLTATVKEFYKSQNKYEGIYQGETAKSDQEVLTQLIVGRKGDGITLKNADDITQNIIMEINKKKEFVDRLTSDAPYLKSID